MIGINDYNKLTLPMLIGLVIGIGIAMTSLTIYVQAQEADKTISEIEEVSVDDNLTNTIKVKLHDGITSSDEIH